MHLPKKPLLAALTALLLSPLPVHADTGGESAGIFISTLEYGISSSLVFVGALGLTSTGAGITITVMLKDEPLPNEAALLHYFRHERDGLRQAHALGAGAAADDLATLLNIPHERVLLGAIMRERRVALNAALDGSCDDDARCKVMVRRYISVLRDGFAQR